MLFQVVFRLEGYNRDMKVLYVEDEKYLADAVRYMLEKSGIDVDVASDGEAGCNLAVQPIYDCLILDVMLPKMSGLDILRHLRERRVATPVLMLSALSEVEDKVRGLDYGADDYLAKPFKTKELVARVRALVRRPKALRPEVMCYEDLKLDIARCKLGDISLSDKEISLLTEFFSAPEKLVSKKYLLSKVWGEDGDINSVEAYISRLRRMMSELGTSVQIKTVRGRGYILCS